MTQENKKLKTIMDHLKDIELEFATTYGCIDEVENELITKIKQAMTELVDSAPDTEQWETFVNKDTPPVKEEIVINQDWKKDMKGES